MTVLKNSSKTKTDGLIQDEDTKQLLARSLRYLKAGYPIHYTGPTGAGKTSLALALAKKRRRPVMLIHGHHELDNKDLIGDFTGYTSKKIVDNYVRSVYKKDETVHETWRDGRLLEAVKHGYTLVYDEFTRSKPTTNNLFLSILEEKILPLYGLKKTEPFVPVHPDFRVIFTSNPEEYAGVFKTQDALLDRVISIIVDYKDQEHEATIAAGKFGLEESQAKKITTLVSTVREECTGESGPSLRASLMIAKLVVEEGIAIDGENEEFKQLCLDILGHQLSRCIDADQPMKAAEERIVKALKQMNVSH
ncbi:gas vesicle protein GvpN [Halalkalibacter oceani]|uniref:gas vesicle protein GvpN n=1 Tax=Halalkalibacter oceani TaxID=1653776 RepID=UPI0033920AA1